MPHGLICAPRLFAMTGRSCTACDAPDADSVPELPDDVPRHDGDPARGRRTGALRPLPDAVRRAGAPDRRERGRRSRAARRVRRARRAAPDSRAHIEVEEPAAQEDITLEGRHIEISGRYRMPDSARGEPQIREETRRGMGRDRRHRRRRGRGRSDRGRRSAARRRARQSDDVDASPTSRGRRGSVRARRRGASSRARA